VNSSKDVVMPVLVCCEWVQGCYFAIIRVLLVVAVWLLGFCGWLTGCCYVIAREL